MLDCPDCDERRRTARGLFYHLKLDHGYPHSDAYEAVGESIAGFHRVEVQTSSGRWSVRIVGEPEIARLSYESQRRNARLIDEQTDVELARNYDLPDLRR